MTHRGNGMPVVATMTPLPARTQINTSSAIDGQPVSTLTTTGV